MEIKSERFGAWMKASLTSVRSAARASWTIGSEIAHRVGHKKLLATALIAAGGYALVTHPPIDTIEPGEVGVRINRLTGGVSEHREGFVLDLPGLHRVRHFPLRDRVYRPQRSSTAKGDAPFQSVEGLSLGAEVTVRYALDPTRLAMVSAGLPENVDGELIEPTVDGILHRVFATHTVREIFSTQRLAIQKEIEEQLRPELARDGVQLRTVFLGNVDLPQSYRSGLESLLAEELSSEKMRYTLELKDKQVKEAELTAEADKVRRQKSAEAAGQEEIIAAKSKEEAMKHVLPFREKEIEARRLEAEATKVSRIKQAEGEAEARKIEAGGEAESRKKLAEAEAYRTEITGKATAEQMGREGALLAQNPLLIQKTLADKLSDKISVIIAPPNTSGFIAANLLGSAPGTSAVASKTALQNAQAQAGGEP
jgi:regulator of protease activity HflC (stomatin/prohibitin superfamily)